MSSYTFVGASDKQQEGRNSGKHDGSETNHFSPEMKNENVDALAV